MSKKNFPNINSGAQAYSYKQSGNFAISYMSGGIVKEGAAQNSGAINLRRQQNLAETIAEIKGLLKQLSQEYPTSTLVEQAVVAQEAIEQIENNPTFKQRTIAALKVVPVEAFVELIDHPVVNIMRSGLEAWENDNLVKINDTEINRINQLSKPNSQEQKIKELLSQLQEAIANETNLEDEDKYDALEEVKNLAEAVQNPDEGEKKMKARKAIRMLKRIFMSLPSASKIVQDVDKLVDEISKLPGLGD